MKKKALFLILSTCLILSLMACGKKEPEKEDADHTVDVQTEEEQEKEELSPEEQAVLDGTVPADDVVINPPLSNEEKMEEYLESEDVKEQQKEFEEGVKIVQGKCVSYEKLEAFVDEPNVFFVDTSTGEDDFGAGFYAKINLEFSLDGKALKQEMNYQSPTMENIIYDFVLIDDAGNVYCPNETYVNSETCDVTLQVLPLTIYEKMFN